MPDDKAVFRARLEESGGLFRAFYRGDMNRTEPRSEVGGEGEHILPDTHIGVSEETVRAFVEELARSRGYEQVVWE